jgi:hypothetical protein
MYWATLAATADVSMYWATLAATADWAVDPSCGLAVTSASRHINKKL